MTNSRIDQLTEATDLVNTDLFLLEQNTTAKKLTWRTFLEKTLAALSGQSGILRVSNPNLLDNPWFTVNQRGAAAYTVGAYGVDRWKLISGSATVTANGITLNGTLRQILEQKPVGEVKASVKMYGGTGSASYDSTTGYFDIASSGGTVRAAKLEAGSVSTLGNDQTPNYAVELSKCQRYYQRFSSGTQTYFVFALGYMQSATSCRFFLPLTVPMRTKPTINSPEAVYFNYGPSSTRVAVSGFSVNNMLPNQVFLSSVTASEVTTGAVGEVMTTTGTGVVIELTADL